MASEGSDNVPYSCVELLGIGVHYRREGEAGPAVVLLHHTFGNVATWRHVVDGLAPLARVAAFDRPGYGFTARPAPGSLDGRDPYTRATSVDLTIALMDHLEMEEAVLVGSSAGGTVAIEAADRHPDRVRALVLIAPAITGDVGPPSWSRPLLRPLAPLLRPIIRRRASGVTPARVSNAWYDPSLATDEDARAYLAPMNADGWETGFWWAVTAEPKPDLRAVLPTLGIPTVVVSGSHDRTVSPRSSRAVAEAIPDGRYVELDRVGHTPQEEAPDRLLAVLRDLVAPD